VEATVLVHADLGVITFVLRNGENVLALEGGDDAAQHVGIGKQLRRDNIAQPCIFQLDIAAVFDVPLRESYVLVGIGLRRSRDLVTGIGQRNGQRIGYIRATRYGEIDILAEVVGIGSHAERDVLVLVSRQVEDLIAVDAGKEQVQLESLVRKIRIEVSREFRPGVADNGAVVVIDEAVLINIPELDVTGPRTLGRADGHHAVGSLYRVAGDILITREQAIGDVAGDHAERLSYFGQEFGLAAVGGRIVLGIDGGVQLGHLVAVDREIDTRFPLEIPCRNVDRIDRDADAFVLHGAIILDGPGDHAAIAAIEDAAEELLTGGRQDEVGDRLFVCIGDDLDAVVEQMGVQTDVAGLILFQLQRGVGEIGRSETGAPDRGSGVEIGVDGAAVPGVTRDTVLETEFQIVEPGDALHELFIRDLPGQGCGGEITPLVLGTEIGAAVPAEDQLRDVFVIVGVIGAGDIGLLRTVPPAAGWIGDDIAGGA